MNAGMVIDPVTKAIFKFGYYSYINGIWQYLSPYVSSVPVKTAYRDNNTIYWASPHSQGTKIIWRQMIVPGRWRALQGEPKPLQMMRLVGAL